MSIRSKLAWTFILLLIFGITAISSYSILFIRNYLLEEGLEQIRNDTELLAITIQNLPGNSDFETELNETALSSGYRLAVYDAENTLFAVVPYNEETNAGDILSSTVLSRISSERTILVEDDEETESLIAYVSIPGAVNPVRYLRVSQLKDQIYAPIKTIRWIIYTGMFISIGLVIFVSVWFAGYMSKPILQLEEAAKKIAYGDVDTTLQLNRSDEFGMLADSLNRMASRLREDTETLQSLYDKQGQFFADITHELRNPLHTITGALEMLQLDTIPEKQKQYYLATATRQTERINRLFRDLVVLQRYDSDQYFIEKSDFNLSGILTRVYELFYPEAKSKEIELDVDTRSFYVHADQDKIEQVFENLVSNSLKYTNEGVVRIQCEEMDQDVCVEVIDTGIGISEEHIERLFDRFYRTDKARSRDKGGTGLGLSVVKSILDAHGSAITVESTPGKGTSISFRIRSASQFQKS